MTDLIRTKTFIKACLDENQTSAYRRIYSQLAADYQKWADAQYEYLETLSAWPKVLEETLRTQKLCEGLICEFGVCTGNSTNLIARAAPGRQVYGFDSFEGFPQDWIIGDLRVPKDWMLIDPNKLKLENNVRLVKGFFDQSLPGFLRANTEPIAFLHIDCDTYQSTTDILIRTRDRFQVGTILVFDEILGNMGLENEMKSLWDHVISKGFAFEWLGWGEHCWTETTQALFKTVKRPNPLYHLKLYFYNLGSIVSHLRNRKKVEEAYSAAAIRITKLP